MMLLFAVLPCLLIYNIKNARIDRRALIELALFTAPFFVTITIMIVLLALNNYSALADNYTIHTNRSHVVPTDSTGSNPFTIFLYVCTNVS